MITVKKILRLFTGKSVPAGIELLLFGRFWAFAFGLVYFVCVRLFICRHRALRLVIKTLLLTIVVAVHSVRYVLSQFRYNDTMTLFVAHTNLSVL